MATSLTPQDLSQAPNTAESSAPLQDSTPLQPESTPTQTPPTNQPAAQPTRSAYEVLLEESMRALNRQTQDQAAEIERLRRGAPAPTPEPVAQPTADPTTFFNNPQGVFAEMESRIKKHLDDTVKPLHDFVRTMRGDGTPYGNLKAQFQNDPAFKDVLNNPKIAFAVDKIMENQEARPDLMQAAIVQAAGLNQLGQLDVALVRSGVDPSRFNTPAPAPSNNQPPPEMRIVPPHTPPTPPSAPVTQDNTPKPVLNELQKRLAREKNMTDEQFLQWVNEPADKVATSRIGKPNG